jgi:uncharacterized protein
MGVDFCVAKMSRLRESMSGENSFQSEAFERKGCSMSISKELLDILACPKCKGDIHLNEQGDGLICDACRLMYPIKDDIPVMLIDEAVRL